MYIAKDNACKQNHKKDTMQELGGSLLKDQKPLLALRKQLPDYLFFCQENKKHISNGLYEYNEVITLIQKQKKKLQLTSTIIFLFSLFGSGT